MKNVLATLTVAAHAPLALAALTSFTTPAALEGFVGSPLALVPDDGLPVGTLYGSGATPLLTPYGPMSFAPVHTKVAPGIYHPFTLAPLAGSDVVAPAGAVAMDFLFTPLAPVSFAFGAIGSLTTATPVVTPVLTPGVPYYVGFAATGESITMITIATVPFGTTPAMTWDISAIRVLPAPHASIMLALAATLATRRRR